MYIFLDVDGVLNTSSDWKVRTFSLNSRCVSNFIELIKQLDSPIIVLSSSWRMGIARDGTTAVHIENLLEAIEETGIKHFDKTAISPEGSRTKEIEYYLSRHDKDSYIILDDDPSLFEQGVRTPNLYLINPMTGLTDYDTKRILSKLTK